jgi:peptidoglycan hydrolase-like protein with peptidoglycan-binding domain
MHHRIRILRVRTIMWLAVLVTIPALPGTAMAQTAAAPETAAQALSPRLLADASWHGRPIQRPFARRTDVSDRGAGLRPGTGYSRPGGSRRVRDVQRRLNKLGYRPGPSDGLYGPRTQAAVLAFQRKHGLERTGSVGSATLRIMQRRTAPAAEPPAPADSPQQTQTRPPQTQPQPPIAPAQATDNGVPAIATILLLALAIPLVLLVGMLVRGRRQAALERPAEQLALPAYDAPYEWMAEPRDEELVPKPAEEPRVRRVTPPRHVPSQDRRSALRERILAMRAEGMTLQAIADQLTAEGEVTPGGSRQWQPWSVRAATRPIDPRGRHIADDRHERG